MLTARVNINRLWDYIERISSIRNLHKLSTTVPCMMISGLACQKHMSRTGTSNYIPQILWDVITCPSPWYPFLPHKSSYKINSELSPSSHAMCMCYIILAHIHCRSIVAISVLKPRQPLVIHAGGFVPSTPSTRHDTAWRGHDMEVFSALLALSLFLDEVLSNYLAEIWDATWYQYVYFVGRLANPVRY